VLGTREVLEKVSPEATGRPGFRTKEPPMSLLAVSIPPAPTIITVLFVELLSDGLDTLGGWILGAAIGVVIVSLLVALMKALGRRAARH
jgi:hypothetical protein